MLKYNNNSTVYWIKNEGSIENLVDYIVLTILLLYVVNSYFEVRSRGDSPGSFKGLVHLYFKCSGLIQLCSQIL